LISLHPNLARIIACERVLITGTDTDIGKTHVSCALLDAVRTSGSSAVGLKPIASGASESAEFSKHLENSDVLRLRAHSSNPNSDYALHNWYTFAPAIAPHIAARGSDLQQKSPDQLRSWLDRAPTADFTLIEGAGGFCSPLFPLEQKNGTWADNFEHADLARTANAGVIVIVGLRLGCIHQARSTIAMVQQQARFVGWIANDIDASMQKRAENLQTIIDYIGPPLARLGFGCSKLQFDS
jgi:dethiobiotin synthetase